MNETNETGPRLTVRAVMAIVAIDYGVKYSALLSRIRTRQVVEPRQVAMWLATKHLPASYPQVGRCFGDRDHTTVLNAVRVIDARAGRDPDFAARLERLGARVAAAEAAMLVELTAIERVLATRDEPAATLPAELVYVPRGMTSIVDAVGQYLDARARQQRDAYTASEASARRVADATLQRLARAYASLSSGRTAA